MRGGVGGGCAVRGNNRSCLSAPAISSHFNQIFVAPSDRRNLSRFYAVPFFEIVEPAPLQGQEDALGDFKVLVGGGS